MNLRLKLLKYAAGKLNKKDGNGECWTLINNGLKEIKAQTPDCNIDCYNWPGTEIDTPLIGSILQYKNYKIKIQGEEKGLKIKVKMTEGEKWWDAEQTFDIQPVVTYDIGWPRHTSIFKEKHSDGAWMVYEQNYKQVKKVQLNKHYFGVGDYSTDKKGYREIFSEFWNFTKGGKKSFPIIVNLKTLFGTDYKSSNVFTAKLNGTTIKIERGKIKISLDDFFGLLSEKLTYSISEEGGTLKIYNPQPLVEKEASLFHPPSELMALDLPSGNFSRKNPNQII